MRKEFIVPSLEVKKFNRVCLLDESAVKGSNVDDAQTALEDAGVSAGQITVLTI